MIDYMGGQMPQSYNELNAKTEFKNFLVRLGKIFSNIAILGLILSSAGIMSFVALAFTFIFGFLLIVMSLGTIFILVPNFSDIWLSVADTSSKIASFFMQNFYIFAGITIVFSILSFVLLIADRQSKHTARLVISGVIIAILLIFIVVALVGVGK